MKNLKNFYSGYKSVKFDRKMEFDVAIIPSTIGWKEGTNHIESCAQVCYITRKSGVLSEFLSIVLEIRF